MDGLTTERILLAGFIALFPTGGLALGLARWWVPLVYVFWLLWPITALAVAARITVIRRR